MVCKNCNMQIQDDALFCPRCGAKLSEDNETTKDASAGTRKRKTVVCIVSLLGVVILITLGVLWHFSPVQKFKRYIDEGDFYEAARCKDEMSVQEIELILDTLYEKSMEAYRAYNHGKTDYTRAFEAIGELREIYDFEKLEKVENNLNALLASKEYIETAKQAEEENDRATAIIHYQHVIPSDAQFGAVQEKIEQLKHEYKQEVLTATKRLRR